MVRGEPEYRIYRREVYDPSLEDYVREELPTKTIKRTGRLEGFVAGGTLIASHDIGPGSYWIITRLNIATSRSAEFAIIDRTGTIDYIYLEAAGMHAALGERKAPIMVLEGSAEVRNIPVGTAIGTFSVALEGLTQQFGTETVS